MTGWSLRRHLDVAGSARWAAWLVIDRAVRAVNCALTAVRPLAGDPDDSIVIPQRED